MSKNVVLIVVVFAVFVLGSFYWFELRPTNIRKECDKTAREDTIKATIQVCDASRGNYEGCLAEHKPKLFQDCLHSKGL